jgi:hypothetical protein
MSVARPAASAASAALRRPAPAAPPAVRTPGRAAFFETAARDDDRDELRLNLRDLPPVTEPSMEVEGFKPSLLSRLFDLVAPIHKR